MNKLLKVYTVEVSLFHDIQCTMHDHVVCIYTLRMMKYHAYSVCIYVATFCCSIVQECLNGELHLCTMCTCRYGVHGEGAGRI